MKKQTGFKKLFPVSVMALVFYLIMKYQDTEVFQNTMRFLFNPDASLALPAFWQDYRMLFLGAAAGLVMLYYKPVWLAYRNLSRVYKKGTQRQDKPDLPVLQASYLYRQDQTMGLVTLLIDLCRRGVLTLNYAGGEFPWSVSRKTDNSDKTDSELNTSEKKIIEILLQNKATIPLKASLSDPEPDVQEAAEELFREIKNNNHQISHRKSLFPALIFLLIVIGEIPFFVAGLSSQMPAIFVIALFSAAITAVPATVITADFPVYSNEPELPAFIKLLFALLLLLVSHLIMFSNRYGLAPWWSFAMYPDLAVIIIVSVYKVPLLPENPALLQQIISYRKFLNHHDYRTKAEDLPWTLALGLHTGLLNNSFIYGEETVPEWIHLEIPEGTTDVQSLMKLLHQTLPVQVNQAINGRMKSKSSLVNRDISKRY